MDTTTTASPAEIDTEIARLQREVHIAYANKEQAEKFLSRWESAEDYERSGYSWFAPEKVEAARVASAGADEKIQQARSALVPLNAEFSARGGWNRYYLVTNAGGHVHWTMDCSTCFPTTQFAWLTDYSGMDRAAFVEEAGSKACTVCFPDATVEVYSRATRIKYESSEAKERREEREAKAAAKAAAEIVVEDFCDYGRPKTKAFKSARAVTNAIAGNLSSLCRYGMDHPTSERWVTNIAHCRAALTAKGVEYDYDKALAAARKKVTREGDTPRY